MTCPHLKDGRCIIGEFLIRQELGLAVNVPTTEPSCQSCLAEGQATFDKPTLVVLDNIRKVCPSEHKVRWVGAATRLRYGSKAERRKQAVQAAPGKPKKLAVPGVGTIIAQILKDRYGRSIKEDCGCTSLVKQYNSWGPDQCEKRIDEITSKLVEAAKKTAGLHRLVPDIFKYVVLHGLVQEAIADVRERLRLSRLQNTSDAQAQHQPS